MLKSEEPNSSALPSTKPSSSGSKTQDQSKSGKTKRGRGGDDDGWGGFRNYMDAKMQKLDDQFDVDRKRLSSKIFAGVAIHVNGYTIPSSDELRRLMQENGGRYEPYMSMTRVTHVIATNLPNSKFKMTKTMPVVKPEWITESVAAGKRLSHVPYLLLSNQSKLQPGLKSFQSVTSLSRSSTESSRSSNESSKPATKLPLNEQWSTCGKGGSDLSKLTAPKVNIGAVLWRSKPVTEELSRDGMAVQKSESCNIYFQGFEEIGDSAQEQSITPADSKLHKDVNDNSRKASCGSHEQHKMPKIESTKDDSDDDIVYNSEEEDGDSAPDRGKPSTTLSHLFQSEGSPYKRRSRVYSFRKFRKSNSGSFDSPKPDDTNSCDGFIDCSKLKLPESEGPLLIRNEIPKETESKTVMQFVDKMTSADLDPFHLQLNSVISEASLNTDNKVPVATLVHIGSDMPESVLSPSTSTEGGGSLQHISTQLMSRKSSSSEAQSLSTNLQLESVPPVSRIKPQEARSSSEVSLISPSGPQSSKTASTSPTSPSHQQQQLQPPHSSAKSSPQKTSITMARAGDKNFLNEFYSNSRLHHLSTWGAEFKAYVSEIQRSSCGSFPGREKLRQAHVENVVKMGFSETLDSARHGTSPRTIMHIDMDCFFVSVGLLARPDLKGKPIAVTHSRGQGAKPNPGSDLAWEKAQWTQKRDGKLKGEKTKVTTDSDVQQDFDEDSTTETKEYDFLVPKGSTGVQTFHSMAEIASCSYEARQAGVKNGMFMGRAMQLCPDLQTIPYNFAEYNRISRILYDVVASYTHDIEAVSCDEMLIDCTDVLTDTGATAMEFATVLRSEMMEKTGCPASTGIGPNILLARLATRRAKPNGQYEVLASDAKEFIKDQAVSDLPGVGYSMTRKLTKLGVQTCGDLQGIPVATLRKEFGPKTGESLHRFSLGQDDREVKGDKQRKSVSAEVNYGIRFTKELDAVTFLKELSQEVKRRLDAISVKGRSITLKLMVRRPDAPAETAKFMGHGICNNLTKSSNLPVATNDGNLIAREVVSLYRAQHVMASDVRGIGIQVTKLESSESLTGQPFRSNKSAGHQSILNFAVAKNKASSSSASSETTVTAEAATTMRSLDTSEPRTLSSFADPNSSFIPTNSATLIRIKSGAKTNHPSENTGGEDVPDFSSAVNSSSNTNQSSENTVGRVGQIQAAESEKDSKTDSVKDFPSLKYVTVSSSSNRAPNATFSRHSYQPCSSKPSDSGCAIDRYAPSTSGVRDDDPGPSTSRENLQNPADVSFLSESQIDTDVLQELPSDIAQEILEEVRRRKKQRQKGQQNPSTSRSSSEAPGSSSDMSRVHQENKAVDALPALSQLDLSCFNALPLHLQQELKAEYAKQEVTSQTSADKRAALTEGSEFTRLKSPPKDKGKQPTGIFKVPKRTGKRGRPPGKKKLQFGDSKVKRKGSNVVVGSVSRSKKPISELDVIICDDDDDGDGVAGANSRDGFLNGDSNDGDFQNPATVMNDQAECMEMESRNTEIGGSTHHNDKTCGNGNEMKDNEPVETPSFCGAVWLKDVRALLKEWLVSCSEPQPDDVAMVTEYVIKLVQHKNLEQAFYILRFLGRKGKQLLSPQWQICVADITDCVQNILCASYGASFKL